MGVSFFPDGTEERFLSRLWFFMDLVRASRRARRDLMASICAPHHKKWQNKERPFSIFKHLERITNIYFLIRSPEPQGRKCQRLRPSGLFERRAVFCEGKQNARMLRNVCGRNSSHFFLSSQFKKIYKANNKCNIIYISNEYLNCF